MKKTTKTGGLVLCAFFATLTIIGTILSIPLPFSPVPINLAILSVFLAGGLLGPKAGAVSQLVYVCLGLMGLPVFAKFSGGPGVLAGPTGGYIIGYIVTAFLAGLIIHKVKAEPKTGRIAAGFSMGLLACYVPGTLWFMYVTGAGLMPALAMCVFPFLPGDGFKVFVATILTKKMWPLIR